MIENVILIFGLIVVGIFVVIPALLYFLSELFSSFQEPESEPEPDIDSAIVAGLILAVVILAVEEAKKEDTQEVVEE